MDGLKSKTLSTAIGYFCGFEMIVTIFSTKWLWKCVWWKYVPPTSSILSSNSKRAILNFQKHSDVIKGCSYAFDAFNDNFKHLLKCATLYDVELRECSVCNISVSLRYFIFLRQNGNLMRLWKSFPINILLTIFLQSWMMLKRREIAKKGPKNSLTPSSTNLWQGHFSASFRVKRPKFAKGAKNHLRTDCMTHYSFVRS